MRIVFAGTPNAAVPTLHALAAGEHDVVAVVTRPDAPLGRKRVLTPSPVAQAAEQLGLPVLKPARLDENATEAILAARPELGVIVAYGALVREPLLSAPTHGWVNLHVSLLPAWRGAAPVQRAVIAGDESTGAAVFRLVPELDAGDVYDRIERAIAPDETAGELLDALAVDGAALVARVVDAISEGTAVAVPQQGTPTLAPKLGIEDARLDLTQDARTVYARLRGVTPEPGAFITIDGAHVKVLSAARSAAESLPAGALRLSGVHAYLGTATSPLELISVQPAGKRAMTAADWLRGMPAGVRADLPHDASAGGAATGSEPES
jgi:methionyl-tRNA formyltransferase